MVPGLGDRLCLERRWDPTREREIDWAHGAFVLVRREAFDAVGGFDTDQWMYAEDLDLGWRLARAGGPTRFVPAARVRHEVAAATSQQFADDERAAPAHGRGAGLDGAPARARRRPGLRGDQRARVRGAARSRWRRWRACGRRRFAERRALEARYLRLHGAGLRG